MRLGASIFLGLIFAQRGFGDTVLMSNLGEPYLGSYNFGSVVLLAVPIETSNSPVSVQSIVLLMQQYQTVADQPYV